MVSRAPSIVLDRLSKRYAGMSEPALDNVSLRVKAGEVYGFLGANGAGKSTTIRTLLNFIQPSSGSATIMGLDIVKDSVSLKRHVGYLAGEIALYSKVTGRQFIDYMAELQPLKDKAYVGKLVERFDIDLAKPLEQLSKGNRQKIGLLQAFMHQPDVLILDEPTSGLDPLMQEEFYRLVKESAARGGAIFFSSHNLTETQRVCDRIGIIKHGRLIREQSIDELGVTSSHRLRVVFASAAATTKAKALDQLKVLSQPDARTLVVEPKRGISPALAALSKFDITGLSSEKFDLESEFLEFYEDKNV